MNASFPYEQLIAQKLEELAPLPDMADSIWQRITAELDRDMPSDDDDFGGDGGPADSGPVSGWKGWTWLLLLGGIAALLIYQLKKEDKYYSPLQISTPAEIQQPDSSQSPGASPPPENNILPNSPPVRNEQVLPVDSGIHASEPFVLIPDSVQPASVEAGSQVMESSQNEPAERQEIVRPDSSGARKRPSGIKGIRSNDYRIVPPKGQKDSS